MLRFKDYIARLDEKFINWWTENEDQNKKFDELWIDIDNMLKLSYAKIGGYMNGKYTKEEFLEDSALIKIVLKNKKPVAFRAYKDKNGRKAIASGTDGSEEGKKAIKDIWKDDTHYRKNVWAEVSDSAEYNLLKIGAEMVPAEIAKELLSGKEITPEPDGFHYKRMLGKEIHTKVILTGSTNELIKKLTKIN